LKLVPCRDCGEPVDLDSRGCPRCARNLDAERAIARFLRWLTALVAVVLIAAAYFALRS